MGFLSDSARTAYKRGSRRAHVPAWFVPAAYVFGGLIGVFLVVGTLFSDLPEPAPTAENASEVIVVISGDGETSTAPATDEQAVIDPVSTLPSTTGGTDAGSSTGEERVELLDGGSVTLPAGAWSTAQQVTFALLTGDFSQVKVYPGKTAPILLTTWDEPSILGLVSADENPDGSLRVVLRVDPDVSGSEPPRDVPILLAASEGGWAYLPG